MLIISKFLRHLPHRRGVVRAMVHLLTELEDGDKEAAKVEVAKWLLIDEVPLKGQSGNT